MEAPQKSLLSRLWPPHHDALLKKLHEQGYSFGQIANEIAVSFNASYTRNACIGRAKRIGLPDRKGPNAKPSLAGPAMTPGIDRAVARAKPKPRAAKPASTPAPRETMNIPKLGGIHHVPHAYPSIRNPAPPSDFDLKRLRAADVTPLNLALDDLKPDSCRWPYGGHPSEEPITFCGHAKARGSYCAGHAALSSRHAAASLAPSCEAA